MDPNFPGTTRRFAETQGITRRSTQRFRWFLTMLALLLALAQPATAFAQSPRTLRIPPTMYPAPVEGETPEAMIQAAGLRRVIIDTDPGVDDALALVWLLSQRLYAIQVVGIVTVAGNSAVEHGTSHVGFLLNALNRTTIPVIQGAKKPLEQTRSRTGKLIHGPTGLWFANPASFAIFPDPNPALDVDAAVAFYCAEAPATLSPGTLVLALGPLTNIASAISACPAAWNGVEVVSLGGAKFGGNQTPTTEYNYWQDPEAAAIVAESAARLVFDANWQPVYTPGHRLTMVPLDAFSQFTLRQADLRRLATINNPALQAIRGAVEFYYNALGATGDPVAVPDVVAAILALHRALGVEQSALVKVVNGPSIPEFIRGQSVIGLNFNERITMIASDAVLSDLADQVFDPFDPLTPAELELALGAILFSDPDNASVFTKLRPALMSVAFFNGLRRVPGGPSASAIEDLESLDALEPAQRLNRSLYLPTLSVR